VEIITMTDLLDQVQAVLATTPARWQSLTKALSHDLLARPPAPGEWSALDCLVHLLDTERAVFPVRVEAFLAGRDFPAFDPDAEGTKADPENSPADLALRFVHLRRASLALLAGLTDADLPRRARHAELGIVTLGDMLHEWAAHDLMHTVQAERALMQPFIVGSGAWRPYFADHDAGKA
jgi:hypothetical protein